MNLLETINPALWVMGNITLGYVVVALVIFIVGYFVLFDPRATTVGRLIFQFMLSLVGLVALTFVGVFINPASGVEWFEYPNTVDAWRPILRFAGYLLVAYSTTSLSIALALRKWWPHKLRTASDYDAVKLRNTTPINVIK